MMSLGNGVPRIGQRQVEQQMAAQRVVLSCLMNVVPVVAAAVLQRPEVYGAEEQIPDRIAEMAWGITAAAVKKMKRIGIQIPLPDQEPEVQPSS